MTVTSYDGNGNIKKVTDADGFVTEYAYNSLDLVSNINYNCGKQVSYQYNKTGDLVEMQDWTGTTSFEIDLLHRITATNDHKGNRVEYGYDEVGNQISVKYPDSAAATKTYDLVHNLKTVTEADGRTTKYAYDGMKHVTHMDYPDGWQEDYTYDAMGRNTSILDTDPTGKDMKQQKNKFDYDVCGNMTYEYMRGNGTGEATTEVFYTYDALHRVTSAKENYGNARRDYQYDSLGNLTYETNSNNVKTDYRLNNLNQITTKSEDGWKTATTFTYDGRGNLVKEVYGKNKKVETIGAYTYDETNRMVKGVNESGESSSYLYNGLGALVQNAWVIAKNGYGYHDVNADSASATPVAAAAKGNNGKGNSDKPTGSDVKKTSTVVKDFVVDYTVDTMDPLMEYETNGLTYRYVYGNERLSVNITGIENGAGKLIENGNQVRLYYHQDLRGTVDYLTSPMSGKVESWTHYNEWGEITHNAVLKCGQRELDLVKNYTGHEYDAVLNQYYAKARMYDAANRRFTSVDPILDGTRYDLASYLQNPMQLVQYTYVLDNPLIYVDPTGLYLYQAHITNGEVECVALVSEDSYKAFKDSLIQSLVPGGIGTMYVMIDQGQNNIVGGSGRFIPDLTDIIGTAKDMTELVAKGFLKVAQTEAPQILSGAARELVKAGSKLIFIASTLWDLAQTSARLAEDDALFEFLDSLDAVDIPEVTANWNRQASSAKELDDIINTIISVARAYTEKPEYAWFYKEPFIKFTCSEGSTYGEYGFEMRTLSDYAYMAHISTKEGYVAFVENERSQLLVPYLDSAIKPRKNVWDEKVFYTEQEKNAILRRYDLMTSYNYIMAYWNANLKMMKKDIYSALKDKGYIT